MISRRFGETPTGIVGTGARSMAKVHIKGLPELERKLKALPDVARRACVRAVKTEIVEAAKDLRRGAPVDTGELRDSVQSETARKGLEGTAAITADHGKYVINGTSDTPANDFATPVIARVRRRFPDRVVNEVNAEMRKIK
jgi:HK97 gp10 family phage protein